MTVIPDSEIILLKVPLTLDNKNQLTFNNKDEQFNYFYNLPKISVDDATYQRKDGVIRFPEHFENIIKYDYCMYKNSNYSDKWFYAFITGMEYVNDNMTYVRIATDVYQTWQFEIDFKSSFVEREHLLPVEDVPGSNLIPEDLETGEFKVGGTAEIDGLAPIFVIAYSRDPYEDGLSSEKTAGHGITLNGIPTGLFYWVGTPKMLYGMLDSINSKGYADSIVSIFAVPCLAFLGFHGWTISTMTSDEVSYWISSDFKANSLLTTLISTPDNLDGYVPKNAKLRTYPYMYIGYNPVNGNEKIYRYEDFKDGMLQFKVISEINPNPTICFIPQNYRGQSGDSLSDMTSLNGYPQIAWVTDYFSGWLAQNSNIISLQMSQEAFNYEVGIGQKALSQIGSTANAVGTALTGNIAGAVGGFVSDTSQNMLSMYSDSVNHDYYIKNQMAQVEKQAMLPNTGHLGTSATLLGYGLLNDNVFTRYTIKAQFAKRIDDFFSMYGYLTNEVKHPNMYTRPHWNYVKTIGANILGNIPQLDLDQIKKLFDNGITLWHKPETFLDYSQDNRTF